MAARQPIAARRVLTILVMPRPMPAAAAQSTASGHEKRASVGSNGVVGSVSLRIARYPAPMSFLATSAASAPMTVEVIFHVRSRPILSSTRRVFTSANVTAAGAGEGQLAFRRVLCRGGPPLGPPGVLSFVVVVTFHGEVEKKLSSKLGAEFMGT